MSYWHRWSNRQYCHLRTDKFTVAEIICVVSFVPCTIMDSKLFLIEIIVNEIQFEPTFEPIPQKNQVMINIRFSDIMNVDIDPEEFEHVETDESE